MKIKRAAPWGAIRNIVIIFFIIILVLLLTSATTAEQITTSNPITTEQPEILELNQGVEEKTVIEFIGPMPQVEDVTAYKYNITLEDRETLARLVFLESNTESLECQKAIASVVINRMHSGYWGNSINSVVYARNQFTPAKRIPYVTPTAANYEAVDYVLMNGVTLPTYVLYFRANHHFSWRGYVPYTAIDKTYFGYMAKDKH